ncbi:putative secreted glycosidase [Venturia nashicola]|uniref:Putative secreted glycosidase n=1 Tax=Venturia nashicola TaxID=86259 RepID=A0A4Z1P555_9PEZI|nr:putative secreted glycosidase [Venturia nashicola]TLD21814.1 putative secreted glycosidase [Venturia nashicola]
MSNTTGILQGLEQRPIVAILTATAVLYPIGYMIYNVFFHPLRKFPGPWIAAATPWYYAYSVMTGRQASHNSALHKKYGEVVRVKPNELSFISENIWKDVYMHRQGQPQTEKARRDHFLPPGLFNIVNAPDDVHARQRRAVSHAFSDRAVKEQEPLLQKYVDQLMGYLRDMEQQDESFDMVAPLNFMTFDVIADLAFGESFHALEKKQTHSWISNFFDRLKPGCLMFEVMEMPGLLTLFNLFIRPMIERMMWKGDYVETKIAERLERGVGERPDLMSFVLKNNDAGKGMNKKEIVATFGIFMVAGSETTGTLLSGAIYLLQKNPRVMEKLKAEIRGTFTGNEEINLTRIGQLPYLHAVIDEAMRRYPPAPQGISRKSPASGINIGGQHVPGNVVIGVHPASAFRSPVNFSEPLEYIPERWIETDNPRFKNDRRDVFKPFSAGPRNCVGQNLAYAEMKLILAKIVFNFDLELVGGDVDWLEQDTFILWIKKPLMVKVKSVNRR